LLKAGEREPRDAGEGVSGELKSKGGELKSGGGAVVVRGGDEWSTGTNKS